MRAMLLYEKTDIGKAVLAICVCYIINSIIRGNDGGYRQFYL